MQENDKDAIIQRQARELERLKGRLSKECNEHDMHCMDKDKQIDDLLRVAVQMAKGCLGRGDKWHWPAVEFLATTAAMAVQEKEIK